MKKFLLLVISLQCAFVAFAQNPDKVLARVTYNFSHVRDTNSRNNPYTEKMLLVVGKNASIYTSLNKIERELNIPGARSPQGAPFKPVTNDDLYFFATENKMVTRQSFMNAYYLVEEKPAKMNWKITKDTASFEGILCKKATTTFKGRKWTAWYAPDMPFLSGPWKLNGLPGLIIEAYDDKKEVQFEIAGLDNLKKENLTIDQLVDLKIYERNMFFNNEIALPTNAKTTTRADFDKVYAIYLKDPIGFIAAETGAPRSKIFMGSSSTGVSHNIINNPIELPEKK